MTIMAFTRDTGKLTQLGRRSLPQGGAGVGRSCWNSTRGRAGAYLVTPLVNNGAQFRQIHCRWLLFCSKLSRPLCHTLIKIRAIFYMIRLFKNCFFISSQPNIRGNTRGPSLKRQGESNPPPPPPILWQNKCWHFVTLFTAHSFFVNATFPRNSSIFTFTCSCIQPTARTFIRFGRGNNAVC